MADPSVSSPVDPERLAEAERWARRYAVIHGAMESISSSGWRMAALLAEYDRRGAALDAARAELAEMEDLAANLGAERLDALAEVERLRAQRGAALALHCPDEIGGRPACGHCSMAGLDGAGVPVGPVLIVGWPCPTAETLGVTE